MSQQKEWARILASLRKKFCENREDLPELQELYLQQMEAKKNEDEEAAAAIEQSEKPIAIPIPFDRQSMIETAKITAGKNSTPEQMASGYLSTLQKWGYIRRHEKIAMQGPGRPSYTYIVTDYGFKVHLESMKAVVEKDGIEIDYEADFKRLSEAIQDLREATGKKAEAEALRALIKVYEEITENHERA